jgi:hypothetical protein
MYTERNKDFDEEYYNDNNIIIYKKCWNHRIYGSYEFKPCKHDVMIHNEICNLDGFDICNLFDKYNFNLPEHFRDCKQELIRQKIQARLDELYEVSLISMEYMKNNLSEIINLAGTYIEDKFTRVLMERGSLDVIKYCVDNIHTVKEIFSEYDNKILNMLFDMNLPTKDETIYQSTALKYAANYGNNNVIMILLRKYKLMDHKFGNDEFLILTKKKLLEPIKYMIENKMLVTEQQAVYHSKRMLDHDTEIFKYLSTYRTEEELQQQNITNEKIILAKYRKIF